MKKNNSTFYCFSPPVMIATFAIEIILFAYTLIRYRMSPITRLISGALLLLATFQFAEFHVCESVGSANMYSRLGYVAITMLPPVGVHLVSKIANRPMKRTVIAAYTTGIMFALSFSLMPNVFNGYVCAGNYAVFQLTAHAGGLFGAYYYFWLLVGIVMCVRFKKGADQNTQAALNMQAFGYISFVLPTGVVNLLNPTTLQGIPSIMCGFAVIYALLLAFGIAPKVLNKNDLSQKFLTR